MSAPGPVSAALERRLLSELKARNLVVWLDAEGTFAPFIDGLQARAERNEFPATVLAFRDSYLELMLGFRRTAGTLSKPTMLVYLPGFNRESVRSSPLLEIYEPAHELRLRLDTLVRETANGRQPLPEIERFVTAPELTLAGADAWLSRADGGSGGDVDWVQDLDARPFLEHLLSPVSRTGGEIRTANRKRAETLFGTTPAWIDSWDRGAEDDVEPIVGWILCVEYVFDLREPPKSADLAPLRALPKATVARCQAEAARLRKDLPEPYRAWALSAEARLGAAETQLDPRVLGRIDTFRFEALSIYRGAAQALAQGDYAQVKAWADAHDANEGFWVQQEQARRWGWSLIAAAARLGVAMTKAQRPLQTVQTLEEATQRYADGPAQVDRAHRVFEQLYAIHYGPLLPELGLLDEAFEKVRFAYEAWSKQLAADFNRVCRAEGALPPPELQQRLLFEQTVSPLLAGTDRTAFFVLDALRFEMALELMEELQGSGLQLELKPRLAELPTITAVGMNVLAPVTREGRLTPILRAGRIEGFKAGEATVARPEDRVKAMGLRTARPPKLMTVADVRSTPPERLRNQVAQCQLLVVHGKELDDAGEAGFGVEEFQKILRDVLTARQLLEAAGVTQFVFTADHGFLLGRNRASHSFGSHRDAQRRYVWSAPERADSGYLSVPLASLGYEGEGVFLFRDDTDEFRVAGAGTGSFTHGGNSPQERVIPVLKAWRKKPTAEVAVRYQLSCERGDPALGNQRLRVRARVEASGALDFSAGRVDVALSVRDRPDVRVVIKDVSGGGATVHGGALRLDAARAEWAEVFFVLQGSHDERVAVEISPLSDPTNIARPDGFFATVFDAGVRAEPPTAAPAPASVWAERLGDPDAGKVFDFLERHPSGLSEGDIVQLLGSPRKYRQFSARFDGFLDRLTFEVEVVVNGDGKHYRKK